ncbi:hypothetical protein ID866_2854 [Astraeus odoratus]|nr:hypothetical protein ID866_2854 [Astraeus odoratus]
MARWSWSSATAGIRASRKCLLSLRRLSRREHTSSALAHPPLSPHATARQVRPAVSSSPSTPSTTATSDPHALLAPELSRIRSQLLGLLGSSHPKLSEIAAYYFHHPSKQIRPLLVLLFSRATNGLGSHFPLKAWAAEHARLTSDELDAPLSRADVLCDFNPSMPDHTASFHAPFDLQPAPRRTYPTPPSSLDHSSASYVPALSHTLLPTQLRLAQIVEMIHVASLLHDDVIDKSPLRRGAPSAPSAFGNKFAVLGGDFLLGRASAALSRLGSGEVVELIATVIANLVEGEILQMRGTDSPQAVAAASEMSLASPDTAVASGAAAEVDINVLHAPPSTPRPSPPPDRWSTYLRKTYLKTASLMAKGARAAVVLGGCKEGEVWKEVAYAYGRNLGIAFQLVDDILDFSASSSALGKPGSGADLRLGLATGPALFAAEEYPELEPMIARAFKGEGDVERALTLIHASSGVARTRELATAHAEKAREVLQLLPHSDARDALEALTTGVAVIGVFDSLPPSLTANSHTFATVQPWLSVMRAVSALLLLQAALIFGHGGHEEDPNLENADYATRHMATEHHIDSFDLDSFFQLHDLNRDGVWDREEIEAIYGVHHVYSQKKSKDEIEHQKKADHVVETVLQILDKDGDGKITPEEFSAAGFKGLPTFDHIGAEGHHYDVESEFFLHHEEQYHSTPETQTDASYTHPEDFEHFAHHEAIEREEFEREARYQGISVEEAAHAHDEPAVRPPSEGNQVPIAADQAASAPKPKITRGVPPEKQDPAVRYRDIGKESVSQAEWGTGEQGYKQPKSPAERLRKNVPYKERMQYKFRRSWGDF